MTDGHLMQHVTEYTTIRTDDLRAFFDGRPGGQKDYDHLRGFAVDPGDTLRELSKANADNRGMNMGAHLALLKAASVLDQLCGVG